MTSDELGGFLERTASFHEALYQHVGQLQPHPDDRACVAFQAGILSLEHATGALILITQGLAAPGITLMRTQFECLVRGIWLMHAATDNWIEKLSQPLTEEAAISGKANEGPMLAEMLKELDKAPNTPRGIVNQLRQYKDVAWKALNSFSHGGLHPLSRTESGYPPELIFNVVRNSNAVIALTSQLLSLLTDDEAQMEPVRRFHVDFRDCLPVIVDG